MANAAAWAERVAAWRASGLTAPEFCAGRGFAVGTLRWWATRLERERAESVAFPLARVVRRPSEPRAASDGGGVVLEVGGVRVAVGAGFDRATLGAVLDVLEERAAGGGR